MKKTYDKKLRELTKEARSMTTKSLRSHYVAAIMNWESALDDRDVAYVLLHKTLGALTPFELAQVFKRLVKS